MNALWFLPFLRNHTKYNNNTFQFSLQVWLKYIYSTSSSLPILWSQPLVCFTIQCQSDHTTIIFTILPHVLITLGIKLNYLRSSTNSGFSSFHLHPVYLRLFSPFLDKLHLTFLWFSTYYYFFQRRVKKWLNLNIQKTKIMASGSITSWQIVGKERKQWLTIFLGSKITADGDHGHGKRRLLLGRKTMTNLDSISKSRDITLPTKFCLVKAVIFPVVI